MPFSFVLLLPISIECSQDICVDQFMLQIIVVGVAFIRVTLQSMLQKCGPYDHKSVAWQLLWKGFHGLNAVIDSDPIDIPLVCFFFLLLFFFGIMLLLIFSVIENRKVVTAIQLFYCLKVHIRM